MFNQFTLSFAQTVLKQVVQTNSVCQQIIITYLQSSWSSNLAWKFVFFDWRVHQTQSNKNRICSDNWLSCNGCILLVKAWTLFECLLKTAQSNIACKHGDGFVVSLVSDWFSELETRLGSNPGRDTDQVLWCYQYLWFFLGGGIFWIFFIFLVRFTETHSTATLICSWLMMS